MQICIYEDKKYPNFYPLVYSRPVYDLVCGISTLREKLVREFSGHTISLHCRKDLEDTVKNNNPELKVNKIIGDSCLFVNGRIISSRNLSEILSEDENEDSIYKNGDEIVAARLSNENLAKIKSNLPDTLNFDSFAGLSTKNIYVKVYNYIWTLIEDNGSEIIRDVDALRKLNSAFTDLKNFEAVNFINPENIFVRNNVTIKPGVVIDATNGPVYIDKNTFIYPNAVIEGPVYIGSESKIKSGAAINENVSIGSVCKIGGEIEDSIMLPYSNKQHAGFIGHSYLGSWVNLGADTNCSDLKNNYGTVKVFLEGKSVDTGEQFLGVIMGDHSKTAINTMFNTGTVVGMSSNIFGAGFPANYIPSFSWGGADGFSTYDLNKCIKTAKVVFGRRDREFTAEDEKLFETVFNLTKDER
jgi:UDP-N-acetylglucosamine diphosphorylase/glucosamine-1-phosphate N-acetyltransferase